MLEAAIIQGFFKLILGLVGVLLGRLALLWMDNAIKGGKNDFADWIINANDRSKATYYGARLIFVAIIVGAAIG